MHLFKLENKRSRQVLLLCLLLGAAVTAVLWQVTTFEFVNYDDPVYITENTRIQGGLTGDSIRWAFTSHLHGHYHPLTWITHIIDFRLSGMNPFGHHLTSLVLHILNTLLLFLVLNRMTGQSLASGFAAAVFALHPLHVESVAWISDRKDLLCGFFWMSALWAHTRIAEKKSPLYHLLLLTLYILGLLSKSMMITLPLVLLVLDFWPLNRLRTSPGHPVQNGFPQASFGRLLLEKTGLLLVALIFVLISTRAMQDLHVEPKQLAPYWQYDFILFIFHYLQKFLWPVNLTVLYPYAENPALSRLVIGGSVLAVITLAAAIACRRLPFVLTGWLWFIITLLPVAGLIHGGPHRIADRYTYIPLIGLIIALTWGGRVVFSRLAGITGSSQPDTGNTAGPREPEKILAAVPAVLILILLSLLSHRQAARWQNSLALFDHAVALYPNNWVAHNNLGDVYDRAGEQEKAINHYLTALQLNPRYAKANYNLGNTLASLQQYDEALRRYREAIKIYPGFAEAYNNAGVLLARMERYIPAREYFAAAVDLDPEYEEAEKNLRDVSSLLRELDERIASHEKQLQADPDNEKLHNNLGLLYREGGDADKAQQHFREALRLNPRFAGAHNNLGILLAEQGNVMLAKLHFQQAVDIDPEFTGARQNLGRINAIIQEDM